MSSRSSASIALVKLKASSFTDSSEAELWRRRSTSGKSTRCKFILLKKSTFQT
jgi:hypothetical protein